MPAVGRFHTIGALIALEGLETIIIYTLWKYRRFEWICPPGVIFCILLSKIYLAFSRYIPYFPKLVVYEDKLCSYSAPDVTKCRKISVWAIASPDIFSKRFTSVAEYGPYLKLWSRQSRMSNKKKTGLFLWFLACNWKMRRALTLRVSLDTLSVFSSNLLSLTGPLRPLILQKLYDICAWCPNSVKTLFKHLNPFTIKPPP